MTRRLVISYVSVTLLVLLALEIPLGILHADSERRTLIAELKHDAVSLASLAVDTLRGGSDADLGAIAGRYERDTGARVVITDREGVVVADSSDARPVGRSFASRPEIARALAGHETVGTRRSDTLDTDLLYIAVPAASGGRAAGVVRVTYPTTVVDAHVRRIWLVLGVVGLAILAAVTALSVLIARSVTMPLRGLTSAAAQLAAGDLSARVGVRAGPPEVQALADAFNAMAARLEQLVRSHQAFVADAAHQLRTPLQALRLRLENAEAAATRTAKRDLESALGEVMRLSRIVDASLAIARAEREAPSIETVDVTSVVTGRHETWEPLAGERRIELRSDVPAGPLLALATPGHLEQVLDNLIANALDASSEGTSIDLRAGQMDGWVEIHVADHGRGMTADERDRATERFWRLPGGGDGGTGIGLAIVRRLAEVDGGALDLRDNPGGGLDAVVRMRPADAPTVPL